MRIVSILLGLLLGAALFATIMLLPQADMDALVTSTGLANLLPFAAPPVSPTARLLIGAPGFVILAALGFILAPRPRIEDELEAPRERPDMRRILPQVPTPSQTGAATADPIVTGPAGLGMPHAEAAGAPPTAYSVPEATSAESEPEPLSEPASFAPAAEPAMTAAPVLTEEPVPAPAVEPAFAASPEAPLAVEPEPWPEPAPSPVFVAREPEPEPLAPPAPPELVLSEADLVEPLRPPLFLGEADRIDLNGAASAEPNPYAPFADRVEPADVTAGEPRPLMSAAPVPIEPAFSEPSREDDPMKSRDDVTPATAPEAAVDPAALAGLERRMEALDERIGGQLGQIAQQLAEIAQVTRMMARTPVSPAAPAIQIARGTFSEGDARTRIALAARALRASFAPLPALD